MKIAAHITSFMKEAEVCELANKLLEIEPEICRIYIVDNSGHKINYKIQNKKINTTYLDKNYGVGKAVNISIENAIKDRIDWLWLFGDDLLPLDNALRELVKIIPTFGLNDLFILGTGCLNKQPAEKRSLGAHYTLDHGGFFSKNEIRFALPSKDDFSKNYLDVDYAITSGSLLNVALLKKSGIRMAEEVAYRPFFEFCHRIKKQEFKIICVLSAYLYK